MKRLVWFTAVLIASAAFAGEVEEYRELAKRYDSEAIERKAEASMPVSPEARAIYIRALARTFGSNAIAAADALRRDHPNDPWSWYAVAMASQQSMITFARFEPATAKMMELATNPSDAMIALRVTALIDAKKDDAAAALLEGKQSPALLAAKASLLLNQVWTKKDDALAEKALLLFEEARKLDPSFLEGYVRASQQLRSKRRNAEAHALMKQAAALTPALTVHREYWTTVRADQSVPEEKKREEIDADIAALMKERGDWLPVLAEIANEYAA
ncbi:MAG TPA: hypothetical protein VN181_02210, partial [Thermoanaerobaculia bacterium]|nr:hypothetical protein [Thermoanaerobaculia bacterium]